MAASIVSSGLFVARPRRRAPGLLQTSAVAALLVVPAAAQVAPRSGMAPTGIVVGGTNAPRMDVAANGTPIVRINTPNARGVSNNSFRDFNVDARGLILNNSATIVSTNLAGFIDGNGALKTSGPAGLILNQVMGTNPSMLSGYMEVAGSPAQVVVANPNGITCNGCGFINSPWATLTTGAPVVGNDGAITGYLVDRGSIAIGGAGLDASGMRLDLFARAIAVNADVHADVINTGFGAGEVATTGPDGEIVVTARRSDEAAPRFGLDVAALGGMYAKSIRLIGTEAGLGVRVDGTLASLERGFTLGAAGDIQLAGRAIGATTASVRTSGAVDIAGTLYADAGVAVNAGGAVASSGMIASGADVRLDVGGLTSTGVLAAGLARDGSLRANGAIGIGGAGTVALAGRTVAPGALTVNAGAIDLSGGTTQAASASLVAPLLVNRGGQLAVAGSLGIQAGSLTNSGLIQAGDLNVAAATANNDGGTLAATGALRLAASGDLSNARGTIQSGGALTVGAAAIGNAGGSIVNTGTANTSVTARGAIASPGGTIGGNGDVVVSGTSITVGGAGGRLIAGGRLAATATGGSIDASGGGTIASGGDLGLTASAAIDARGGAISSGGTATLKASSLVLDDGALVASAFAFDVPDISLRRGRIEQTGAADFAIASSGTVDYSGARILSGGANFTLGARRLVNVGGAILHGGAGALTVSVGDALVNTGGRIATNGRLALTAGSIEGASGVITAIGDARLVVRGGVGNDDGAIAAGGALALAAGAVTNAGGTISAGGALTADVASLAGEGGRVLATGDGALTLASAGALSARSGTIGGNGDVTVRAGAVDVGGAGAGTNGRLVAGRTLRVTASGLRADGGVVAGDAVDLRVAGLVNAAGGTIQAGTRAGIVAGDLVTDGGVLVAGALDVEVGGLSNIGGTIAATGTGASRIEATRAIANTGGTIQANGDLGITANGLANAGGTIAHAGTGVLTLGVAGALANGAGGSIATNGALALRAGGLVNRGTIASAGAASVDVAGSFDNAGATLAGAGGLTLAAAAIDNAAGRILVTGDAGLRVTTAGAVASRGGAIGGNGAVAVTAGSLDIGGGRLSAARGFDIATTGDARAVGGAIVAGGPLRMTVGGIVDASGGGTIETVREATIQAGSLDLNGGTLTADALTLRSGGATLRGGRIAQTGGGALTIDVAGLLDLSGGSIEANGADARIAAGTLDNGVLNDVGGRILAQAPGALAIDAGRLVNSGRIAGNGTLRIAAGSLANSGSIGALGDATLAATNAFDNRAGTVASGGALALSAGSLVNAGGTVSGASGVTVAGGGVDNDGGRILAGRFGTAGDAAALTIGIAGDLTARGGVIAATGATNASARSIDVGAAGRLTGSSVAATATGGNLSLRGGTIDAATLALTASGTVDASADGLIQGDRVTVRAGGLDTSGGRLLAGTLDANVGTVRNRGGTISATAAAPLTIAATGAIDNSTGGTIASNAGALTLRAGALNNAGGRIAHAGAGMLAMTLGGTGAGGTGVLDNRGGTIATNGGYLITVSDFANAGGTLSAPGAGRIALTGTLSNAGGAVGAGGDLAVGATNIVNDGGAIQSGEALAIDAGALSNRGGRIVALGEGAAALRIAGALDNEAGGLIGSRRGLALAAGSLTNSVGVVTAADAALDLGALTNGGEISAANTLVANVAGSADNAGGVLTAGDLTLNVGSFANRGGSVTATRSVTLSAAGLIDNEAGIIGGPGAVALRGGSLVNGGTISSGGRLDVAIADTLTNAGGGAIYAGRDGNVSAATLINAGSMGAGAALTIAAASLDNSLGSIGADGLLSLKVGSARFGRLGIAQDFALDLTGDSTVAAGETIEAPRNLFLTIGGTLTNAGTIRANETLAVTAGGDLDNQAGGLITAADVRVSAGGAISNAGLIDGRRTLVSGGSLVNTGRIFGDSVTISTRGNIDNLGKDAVFATRSGTLALLTPGTITNADGAMFYALGDLLIAGADGQGRAGALVNSSASIEVEGDAAIAADAITNKRTVFETADTVTRTRVPDFRVFPTRRGYDKTERRYDEVKTETTIARDSGEALLLVGGDLDISTGAFDNIYSTASAGGNLTINATTADGSGVVNNQALVGKRIVERRGRDRSTKDGIIGNVSDSEPYEFYEETTTFTVGSVLTAGGTLTIDGAGISNLTLDAKGNPIGDLARATGAGAQSGLGDGFVTAAPAAATGRTAIGAAGSAVTLAAARFAADGAAATSVSGEAGGVAAATGNAALARLAGNTIGQVMATGVAGGAPGITARFAGSAIPAFSVGLGGLFRFAAANGRFLIETDARFTSERGFISSDYFLDRLGYDPTRVGTRLGDALYEQQAVGRQLAGLTGTNRLAGYADNDTQYRALMDAGVTVARRFQLALGVALTPEQAATLTSDIVLMVAVTVDTPSGPRTALAPMVYLAKVRPGDVRGTGALIAGDAIVLRSADALTNAGVIRARTGTRIEAATLANSGTIEAGRVGAIATTGDLVSRGGAIRGGDLSLSAGGNIDLGAAATTTRFATTTTDGVSNGTMLSNRVSVIDATGDLRVVAVGDLAARGAQLSAGGTATVLTGGSADLGVAVDQLDAVTRSRIRGGRSTETVSDQTVVGTSITAGTGVTVASGLIDPAGTLALTGGTIASATGPVALSATGGVAIGAANESDRFVTDTRTKKSGLVSSTKTTTRDALTADTAIGSTVSGGTVSIGSANGGISVLGSNVVADGDVALSAAGPITIGAAQTRTLEESSRSVKKSGLSVSIGGGGINAFAGVAKTGQASTADSVTNVGSLVGSTGGDVTIVSGGAARVTGSQIVTPGDVRIAADSILVENSLDTTVSTNRTKASSVGLSVNIGSPVIAGAATVARMADTAATTTNARTAGVAAIAGGLAARNTVDTLADKNANIASASASLGISRSSSRADARDETAVGSLIQGGNVALTATGAGAAGTIGVRGSDIVAANDLSLAANGAIDLRGVAQTGTATGSSRSSGASLGVAVEIDRRGRTSGPVATLGVSGTRGTSSSTETNWRETNLAAGGTATVTTPGALNLNAATLSGNRVNVDAGSLDIVSRQDTAVSRSTDKSVGASVSVALVPGPNQVSAAFSAGRARTSGDFASVAEQSGIYAGLEGFGIKVAGNTSLTGAVIASEAEAARNSLSTGTLSVTDLLNRESYKASSVNVGFGLGDIGRTDRGEAATAGTRTAGSALPGIRTPAGNLTATPPVALGASGRQSGTTASAIAPGTITIAADDASSRAVAATIGRDTSAANAGALVAEFDDAKRAEIAQGFDATRQLTAEVGTFFANRAKEEAAKTAEADAARDRGDTTAEARLRAEAKQLRDTYGAGSATRLVATALTGAAGSNVVGGVGTLAQGAAVNVLQGLAVTQVKSIADSLSDFRGSPTASSEGVRAALQAVVGCAGAAAEGSGGCGSAATGAAAGVVVNYLLTAYVDPAPTNGARTLEDQEARKNLVATIVTGIAVGAGLDAPAARTAAQIETENNDLTYVVKEGLTLKEAQDSLAVAEKQIREKPGDSKDSAKAAPALREYIAQLERGEIVATASASQIAFIGGKAELEAYLAAGGTLAGLNQAASTQQQVFITDLLANANLTPEQRSKLAADYGNGTATAKQTLERTFEQSTGQDMDNVNFVAKYETPLRIVEFVTGLAPTSRIFSAGSEAVLGNYENSVQGRIDAFDSAVAKAEASASVAGQKTLNEPLSNRSVAASQQIDPNHVNELRLNGIKFDQSSVVVTGRNPAGQVVFLESGTPTSGLRHIVGEHASQFADIGVPENQIPGVVMRAVTEGKVVGYQGRGTARPIYEIQLNGYTQRIAITVSSNGYIVGANPSGRSK